MDTLCYTHRPVVSTRRSSRRGAAVPTRVKSARRRGRASTGKQLQDNRPWEHPTSLTRLFRFSPLTTKPDFVNQCSLDKSNLERTGCANQWSQIIIIVCNIKLISYPIFFFICQSSLTTVLPNRSPNKLNVPDNCKTQKIKNKNIFFNASRPCSRFFFIFRKRNNYFEK